MGRFFFVRIQLGLGHMTVFIIITVNEAALNAKTYPATFMKLYLINSFGGTIYEKF